MHKPFRKAAPAPPADDVQIELKRLQPKIEQTFLAIGSKLGKYTILEELDRGGMAVVYKALQHSLDREVALKVMPTQLSIHPRMLERFLCEAQAVARLSHSNIINIHEIATENGIYFIAMDYIPGSNLYYYLNDFKPKLVEVLEIIATLCEALEYSHTQRIIHRDLKLNNVIMRDNQTPVLIDFGLAKALEDDDGPGITRTGEIVGSPSYMAPERILGQRADHRSDICSLGIMLYEMLTFKNPYLDPRSIHQTTANVVKATPIPPRKLIPWLPVEVESITLKAMAAAQEDRYQSMKEFHEDIMRYQKGVPVLAKAPSILSRLKHGVRRNWAAITISALTLLFGALFGLSYYIQQEKGKSRWQLIFQDRFNRRDPGAYWQSSNPQQSPWTITDGALHFKGRQRAWLLLDQPFTRDIRLEFELWTTQEDLFNIGAFIYGQHPDSAYTFYLHQNGANRHGIKTATSPFLFSDHEPTAFEVSRHYFVEIQKDEHQISLKLNGIVVATISDLFPTMDGAHRKIGLFSEGCECWFDNLKVYQRAIPLSPSPTLSAARFWERGDFQAALEEYSALPLEGSSNEIAREVLLRTPDCLIRTGQSRQALDWLHQTTHPALRAAQQREHAHYLAAMANRRLGQSQTADSMFIALATRSPLNPAGQSALRELSATLANERGQGALEGCEKRLATLARLSPEPSRHLGELHLQVMDDFYTQGMVDKSAATAQRIAALYQKQPPIQARAMVGIAKTHLSRRNKQAAIEVLNRCIATHVLTAGVWDAWMVLGTIYEYDKNYPDALTIYRKISRECPEQLQQCWLARIREGELEKRSSTQAAPSTAFEDVVNATHPFPLPRLIARYYLGSVAENQFMDRWTLLQPQDRSFLELFARKALMDKEPVVANIYLQEYHHGLNQDSWEAMQIYRLINDLPKLKP
jgi:serine/threonine protein kinase